MLDPLISVACIPRSSHILLQLSGIKGAHCCLAYTAAHLWPSKMVHQLLGKLVAMGINLQAHTQVQSVSPTRNVQSLWTVQTARGAIAARQVVYATNAYTAQILPKYRGRIVPVRGVASHIASPTQGAATPHLVNTYGIRFDPVNNDYLIPRADGSIVVGGARQCFWHDRELWFDSFNDAELIAATKSYFDGYMQRHFRGWEDSGAKLQEVWTGSESFCFFSSLPPRSFEAGYHERGRGREPVLTRLLVLGYSSDFMPHVGEVPDKSGQYIIAGFSGHGMPQILLSTKGVASMIRHGTPFEKPGLPRIFKTSK
jgi:glycine/D-amino acid oxidase-like deaminating enzyme